ncbi:MAG: Minichromosome maintenance protein MCM [Methanonatronarchaeales archaeon]|nr:Minichromosome maintenance protein MCM [Methanonatronarchaeales archaeon]
MAQSINRGMVSVWEEFLDLYAREDLLELTVKSGNLEVEYSDVERFSGELADELTSNPDRVLGAARSGLKEVDLPVEIDDSEVEIRIVGLPDEDTFLARELRSEHIGHLIAVEGLTRKVTEVRPKIMVAAFECQRCGEVQRVEQDEADFSEPYMCRGCERRGPFEVLHDESGFVDSQKIQIQESPEELSGGEQPQSIDIYVSDGLAGVVTPGNKVKVTGILRSFQRKSGGRKRTVFDLFLDGNSIEMEDREFEEIEITKEEQEEIERLTEDPAIYGKIIDSIAPTIYGYTDIKEAIALQLFSGVSKMMPDDSYIRGDIHVLLIGDPGMGKSQVLRYVRNLAPRGVYASGKSSTAAGLTAAAVKDEFGEGRWSLEAGALVLADKGVACIDEVDKMRDDDRSALHEAMEQQCFAPRTQVHLPDGRSRPIGDIVEEFLDEEGVKVTPSGKEVAELNGGELEVLSTDMETFETDKRDVSVVGRREAPKEMLRIELGNGRVMEVTPEHPFHQIENGEIVEVDARKLSEGGFVTSPRKSSVEGEGQPLGDIEIDSGRKKVRIPDHNSPELATFTGYQVSDDGYELNRGEKNGFNFTNTDDILVEDYVKVVESLFDVEPWIQERGDRKNVRVVSKELSRWLQELGPLLEKGPRKKIPERLMKGTTEDLSLLLRAFFDGDGGVYRTQRGYRIRAVVENRELIEQVQELLWRFGIHSTIRREGDVWRIDISRYDDLEQFRREVGFLSLQKRKCLDEAVEETRDPAEPVPGISDFLMRLMKRLGLKQETLATNLTSGQNISRNRAADILNRLQDRLREIQELDLDGADVSRCRDVRTRFGIPCREIAESAGVSCSLIQFWEKNGTDRTEEYREALKEALKKRQKLSREVRRLESLLNSLRWLKIRSVERFCPDFDHVYDLTVPSTHTFLAEGAVAHNSLSIAKAGITTTLRTRCALLGAANPKYGRFDRYEPIAEQINMEPALLSRFDLIFTLTDKPSEDLDSKIASHILTSHRGGERLRRGENFSMEDVDPPIEPELMRKYVSLAKNVVPVMRGKAMDRLRGFYVELRNAGEGDSPVPVTARQLEALVRLAEASARIRLAEEVTEEDASRAIRIVKRCLREVGVDPETEEYDIDVLATGVSKSQRDKIRLLREIIRELESEHGGKAPKDVVYRKAEEAGIPRSAAKDKVQKLRNDGDVYFPDHGSVKLT